MKTCTCISTRTRLIACAAAALLLPACSILPSAEPVDTYLLPAGAVAVAEQRKPLDIAMRVSRPVSPSRLAGNRIAVLPGDNLFSVYKGVRWSDSVPVLLRNRLIEGFRHDGRVASISSEEQSLHADIELNSELLAFQSEYHGELPEVTIRLAVQLVHTGTRRVIARHVFEVRQPAAGSGVAEVVKTFGRAGDALSVQVVDWSVEQAATSVRPTGTPS